VLIGVHVHSDGFLAAAGMSAPVTEPPARFRFVSNSYLRAAVVVAITGDCFSGP